jgi:hypothetical protein
LAGFHVPTLIQALIIRLDLGQPLSTRFGREISVLPDRRRAFAETGQLKGMAGPMGYHSTS